MLNICNYVELGNCIKVLALSVSCLQIREDIPLAKTIRDCD